MNDQKQTTQDDFASAAMMRLIAMGLKKQCIVVPPPHSTGARVPRQGKRDLLEDIFLSHGAQAILSINDALPDMQGDPVLQALAQARDMTDMFDRWHRLERFSHGRHTVSVSETHEGVFQLTHRAHDGGPAPSHVESLIVFGFLTILSEFLGAQNVCLETLDGSTLRRDRAWQSFVSIVNPNSAVLTACFKRAATPSAGTSEDTSFAQDLRQRIKTDPTRRWTVASIAKDASVSTRTLQRRLAGQSLSFSRVVSDARLDVAASYLCAAELRSLSEIAFLTGYADHAHFTRAFSHAVGTTPSDYRDQFRTGRRHSDTAAQGHQRTTY